MTTKVPLSIRQNSGSDRHLIGTFLIPPMIASNAINLFFRSDYSADSCQSGLMTEISKNDKLIVFYTRGDSYEANEIRDK